MDGLDLSIPGAAQQTSRYHLAPPPHRRPSWFRRHLKLASFLLLVMLPTAVTAGYFFAVASDQYVSEAKFVVRGLSSKSSGMLSSVMQSAGMSRADEDTYAVHEYIVSRDALEQLIQAQNIKAIFNRPEVDPLSRFPRFDWSSTFEHFYKYYQEHVEVTLDSSTNVSDLTVRTFRAEDSQRIATALLNASEALVNRMNDRQRDNALRDARKEVTDAEARVQAVASQIAVFRNREALLDPSKQSEPMLKGIDELETMLSRTNLQIVQLTTSTPKSPLIADLRRRAAALQTQITDAQSKVTGGDASMVPKIAAFELLDLQRNFAEKQLTSAITSLEAARQQAERQQLYLDTIVKPNLSDYASYPRPFASTAVVFAMLMGAYLIGVLLVAGAREHRSS